MGTDLAEIRIEPFEKARHQRAEFDCGKPALNEFLRTLVTQYEKRRLGRTFVAVRTSEPHTAVGYYTLAASAVAFHHLPQETAMKLPRHPVPVVLLARLAIGRSAQRQGWGEALLIDALQRALGLSRSLGVFAVEVRAMDEEASSFYAKFGFTALLVNPRHMYLPIRAIEEAFSGPEQEHDT